MPRVQDLTPFIVFGKPDISEAEIKAVSDVLRSGWIGTGKVAKQFEAEMSDRLGGHCIAVSSATIGLVLSLNACGIRSGDEVITTPMTFAATANAICAIGAKPVFVDVLDNGCIDPDKVAGKINARTKAVIPVHYTGSPADMRKLSEIAGSAYIIEDAAHSFGGKCEGSPQGTFGDYGVFSFYATKNITTCEGGMVFTKRKHKAEEIRILSEQGQTSGAWGRYGEGPALPYHVAFPGYKGNMPDVLAAIGLAQLRRWDELSEKRGKVWSVYENAFGKKENGHSQHLFTIRVKNRDSVREELWKMGIGTGVHYTPLHLEPAFRSSGSFRGDFPIAERIGMETMSLPVSSTMTEKDAERVVNAIHGLRCLIQKEPVLKIA